MTLSSIVLIIHVTAVFLLCAALTIEILSLLHLRAASTMAEVRPWINPLPGLPVLAVGSLVVILFSGFYLVVQLSASGRAWAKVAVVALLLMAPFGAITARRMRAIRRAYASNMKINSELSRRLRDPLLKISLAIRTAVFLGIFLLVSAKPGLWQSVSIAAGSAAVGLLLSLLISRRTPSLAVPSVDHGD
jgi:hypothetical protein